MSLLRARQYQHAERRNPQLVNIPLFRTATGQVTFNYRIISLWNILPQKIKLSQSLAQFKALHGRLAEFKRIQQSASLNTQQETV